MKPNPELVFVVLFMGAYIIDEARLGHRKGFQCTLVVWFAAALLLPLT